MRSPVSARQLRHITVLTLFVASPSGCSHESPGSSTTTTETTTETSTTNTETTTNPGQCGNGVVEPGETCDDGEDCSAGVCNSDEYTGAKHCNASCSGLFPGWCGDKALQSTESCDEGGNTATCDADCTPVECGDGLHNAAAGEVCDDGPNNSDEYDATPDEVACNTSCSGKAPHCGDGVCQEQVEDGRCVDCSCGDGIISPPETCDGGTNGTPIDTAECDADCTAVECGDGHHNPAAGEQCDDGNTIDDDECRNDCTTCGNGIVQAGEECDDGNTVDDDGCSNACVKPRLVFVTSAIHNGNLGGLAGADMKCAAAGMTADPNVPPTAWRAWLSDDTGSPSTRFDTSFTGWYRLVDGTPVAKGWSDLTDGSLAAAINLTEAGMAPDSPKNAWSNTTSDGTSVGAAHCNNWTLSELVPDGRMGDISAMSADWTDVRNVGSNPTLCGASLHLYCFENTP